jgi:hypothetical protein
MEINGANTPIFAWAGVEAGAYPVPMFQIKNKGWGGLMKLE